MENSDEGRLAERFVAERAISGSFGSIAITVRDIGELGVQIVHADPLRVATKSRLAFAGVGSQLIELRGIVIWSRLSSSPNESGKYLYRSGIRVEDQQALLFQIIQQLLSRGVLRRDDRSLEKKRDIQLARERDKAKLTIQRVVFTTAAPSADQMLLISRARERLSAHPEEAGKWYNRAKFALSAEESRAFDDTGVGHKEDVLAVWEYLERTIEIPAIAKAFLVR